MQYLVTILMVLTLVGCQHENTPTQNSSDTPPTPEPGIKSLVLSGYWKNGCTYLGVTTDTSMIQTIQISTDLVTRVDTTYHHSDCSGEIESTREIVDTIHDSNEVLIHGYDAICIASDQGSTLVYHVDGNYLYKTFRVAPDVIGYSSPPIDCHNFNDFNFDIDFYNPYVKEEGTATS